MKVLTLLVWLTCWSALCSAHDTAQVDSAASLRRALLDPCISTIVTHGHIDLDSPSFAPGDVVLNRPVTVVSDSDSAVWHFAFGSQQSIVLGRNASFSLADFAIESSGGGTLSTPSSYPSDQWLWPALLLSADASLTLTNMVLYYNAGCASISLALPAAVQGPDPGDFCMDDYTAQVPVFDNQQPTAATQRVVNSEIHCNSASPATQPIGTVWAMAADELFSGLNDTSVTTIVLEQNIHLKLDDGFVAPVIDGRFVDIVGGQAGSTTIDFGFNCAVALVTSSAGIAFVNLTLAGLPGPTECADASQQQLTDTALRPNWGYTPYPAVLYEPNATAVLKRADLLAPFIDCTLDTMRELQQRIFLSVGQSSLAFDGNQTLSVQGAHTALVPLAASSSTALVAQMMVQLQDTSIVCVEDPFPPPGSNSSQQLGSAWLPVMPASTGAPAGYELGDAAAGPADSASLASGRPSWADYMPDARRASLPWWQVVLITLGSVAGVSLLIGALFVWRERQRCASRSSASESSSRILSQVILDCSGSAASGSSRQSLGLGPAAAVHSGEHGDLADIHIGEVLGRGSYGTVYKGTWRNAVVAIKELEFQTAEDDFRPPVESVLTPGLLHPNIVHTYHISTSRAAQALPIAPLSDGHHSSSSAGGRAGSTAPQQAHRRRVHVRVLMVLEFCDRGSLEQAIDCRWFHDASTSQPAMARIYRCLLDIACGAESLHAAGILHGDLKPANCLLSSSSDAGNGARSNAGSAALPVPAVTCKVADFGLSRPLAADASHLTTRTHGTVSYMPPELLRDGLMSRSADVYSFGILMWELLTGDQLYPNLPAATVSHRVVNEGMRPMMPLDCPPGYMRLMSSCWQASASYRPTFSAIVKELTALHYEEDGDSVASTPPDLRSLYTAGNGVVENNAS